MLYDALGYVEQVSQIRKMRKDDKGLQSSAEFLSGLKKGGRLTPVITIIFYYGEEEWDGSRELHSLLGIDTEEYKMLKKSIRNYRINLIDPRRMHETVCFQTDLRFL